MSTKIGSSRSYTELNLLVDGSFETANVGTAQYATLSKVGGWQSNAGMEIWGKDFITKASDGDKVLELDAGSNALNRVWQDVATQKDESYTFTFDYAARGGTKSATNTIEVWWNGEKVGTFDPKSTAWSVAELTVKGTGGKDRIEFREQSGDNDSFGGVIDNVSLVSNTAVAKAEAAAKAAAEAAAKVAAAAEAEAKAKAEAEAKEKAEREAKEKAEKEAKEKAEKEAKEKAEREAKEKAEKEAKEKAEKEAKEKAEHEAKEKAEREAKEKAEHEAKEKAEHEAKEKAEHEAKEKAEHEAKEKAEKEAKEKAEHEAKEKAEKEAKEKAEHGDDRDDDKNDRGDDRNDDDDKHDGRGHGDGDHNDDGHSDNGHDRDNDNDDDNGGDDDGIDLPPVDLPPVDLPPVDLPPVDLPPPPALVLDAAVTSQGAASEEIDGTRGSDKLAAGTAADSVIARGGSDVLVGNDNLVGKASLEIKTGLAGVKDPAALAITVHGVPDGAKLSAGSLNDDGTWSLKMDDLSDLTVTGPAGVKAELIVVAEATDGSGLAAKTAVTVAFEGASGNLLSGGGGDDVIYGSQFGDDIIYGGGMPKPAGTPSMPSDPAKETDNDIIYAGNGNVQVWGQGGDDLIFAGSGNGWYSGGKGNDTIVDGAGQSQIYGNSGDDTIVTGYGDDTLVGGSGFDTLVLSGVAGGGGYKVDLSEGYASSAEFGNDMISGFEAVIGSYADDLIFGSTKDNMIDGGDGNDIIRGGAGADMLTGGQGRDTFVFRGKDVEKNGLALGTDIITDFEVGDVVDLTDMTKSRRAEYALKDDGQDTVLLAQIKGQMVEVAVLENFSGHTLEEMIKDGMILV